MTKLALIPLALVAALAGGGSTSGSPMFAVRSGAVGSPQVSSNWSGYVAVGPDGASTAFSDVAGSWVQPKARCVAGRADAVAFWVGLGGSDDGAPALEQLGTAAECSGNGGAPSYYAWWEIVPAGSVRVPLKVVPGDRVTAAVLVSGQKVTMSLKNETRRTRFSKTVTVSHPLDVSSAEWIAEAPASCPPSGTCSVVPLTNFGSVTFAGAAAIGNAHPGTIADTTWSASPIVLISDGSSTASSSAATRSGLTPGAVPGELSADGRSFSVAWRQNLTPPSP
jgi:peptidase A4-like protein